MVSNVLGVVSCTIIVLFVGFWLSAPTLHSLVRDNVYKHQVRQAILQKMCERDDRRDGMQAALKDVSSGNENENRDVTRGHVFLSCYDQIIRDNGSKTRHENTCVHVFHNTDDVEF